MTSLLEFFKEILTNAKERIKNPLIGTFIMSWIVFNWKGILILLFSAKNIEGKLNTLSSEYCSIWNLFVLPLIVALIYIFGLPYINLWIDNLLSDSNLKQHTKIKKKILFSIESPRFWNRTSKQITFEYNSTEGG